LAISYLNVAAGAYTSNTVPVAAPAGCTNGATILIACIWVRGASAPTITNPANWNTIGTDITPNDGSNYCRGRLAWKLWATGETTYTWTTSGAGYGEGVIIAFNGCHTTSPIDVYNSTSGSGGTTISVGLVNTTTSSPGLVFFPMSYATSSRTFSSETFAVAGNTTEVNDVGSRCTIAGNYNLWTGIGSTGNATATASGTMTIRGGFIVALRKLDATVNLACSPATCVTDTNTPGLDVQRNLSGVATLAVATNTPILSIAATYYLSGVAVMDVATNTPVLGMVYPLAGVASLQTATPDLDLRVQRPISGAAAIVSRTAIPFSGQADRDWPDYSIVPQPDHLNCFNGNWTDQAAPGKTPLSWGSYGTNSWTTDWAGRANHCLSVDSADAYAYLSVDSPDIMDIGATCTVVFDFKTDTDVTGYFYLAQNFLYVPGTPDKYWGWGVYISAGIVGFQSWNETFQGLACHAVEAQTYYQLVGTISGGLITLYLNGQQVDQQSCGTPGVNTSGWAFLFSGINKKYARFATFKGTALSSTQVQALYDAYVDCGNGYMKRHPDAPEEASVTKLSVNRPVSGVATLETTVSAPVLNTGGAITYFPGVAGLTTVTSDPVASILRPLAGVAAGVTVTGNAALTVLKALAGIAAMDSVVSTPALLVLRALSGRADMVTQTSTPDLYTGGELPESGYDYKYRYGF